MWKISLHLRKHSALRLSFPSSWKLLKKRVFFINSNKSRILLVRHIQRIPHIPIHPRQGQERFRVVSRWVKGRIVRIVVREPRGQSTTRLVIRWDTWMRKIKWKKRRLEREKEREISTIGKRGRRIRGQKRRLLVWDLNRRISNRFDFRMTSCDIATFFLQTSYIWLYNENRSFRYMIHNIFKITLPFFTITASWRYYNSISQQPDKCSRLTVTP